MQRELAWVISVSKQYDGAADNDEEHCGGANIVPVRYRVVHKTDPALAPPPPRPPGSRCGKEQIGAVGEDYRRRERNAFFLINSAQISPVS